MNPHNGISLSHKKNEIMPFVAIGMDLENIMLSETSRRDTNIMWYHLYGHISGNDEKSNLKRYALWYS